MNSFLFNFTLEIALFTFLGMLYYFYQKRKLLQYEKNKGPIIMGYILESCLVERGDEPQKKLDDVIEALDNFLSQKISTPPLETLEKFAASSDCSTELKNVIIEGLREFKSS